MKVVLSPNPYRDRGLKAALRARDILRTAGAETALCLPFALEQGSHVDLPRGQDYRNMQEELKNADLLLCFGGDGTILHAAKDANAHNIPILGVNLGSVGFMAELEQGELEMLARLPERKYSIEHRMMLDVTVRRGREVISRDVALNDAVITKGAVARVIDLTIRGDGVPIYSFSGDGVILATPTGSTAYSMSAGGPIVEPTAENILVTPICAHSLQAKPLVMGRERVVSVRMGKLSRKTAYLSVDGGRAFKLCGGDTVDVRRSRSVTRLVRLTDHSFYEIIDQKLGKA
ncbi:NAD(+)/NADH kinase [Intestinimonas butyriciproducens]|uniref:NAD kinase n=1 Tax=Candidatus Intestinimonas merdavium TaxID=2838622 RepID=A0A9D1Z2D0_9FIRM|nr:NAD(+)/NADH kinase [Intestinimonas butyriciproducens]MBM6975057.1 NAD(+)/NADH kinase [Intestinimonas butyriciproducens]HIY72365.1 NAD(+)/NADH kinase [Candidatus Intestinimonas merdavium]